MRHISQGGVTPKESQPIDLDRELSNLCIFEEESKTKLAWKNKKQK